MILLIQLPWTIRPAMIECLENALGAEAVGWLGRTVARKDVKSGLSGGKLRILAGVRHLSEADGLADVRLVATLLPAADSIPLAEFTAARKWPDHRHHDIANTLSLDEIIAEGHQFRDDLLDVATQSLSPRGGPTGAAEALAALGGRPAIVGLATRPAEFAAALARARPSRDRSAGRAVHDPAAARSERRPRPHARHRQCRGPRPVRGRPRPSRPRDRRVDHRHAGPCGLTQAGPGHHRRQPPSAAAVRHREPGRLVPDLEPQRMCLREL